VAHISKFIKGLRAQGVIPADYRRLTELLSLVNKLPAKKTGPIGLSGSPELSVGESSRPVSLALRWVEILQDR
jgi:hypothetical protein